MGLMDGVIDGLMGGGEREEAVRVKAEQVMPEVEEKEDKAERSRTEKVIMARSIPKV